MTQQNQIVANPFGSVPVKTNATASTDSNKAIAEVQASMMLAMKNPRDQRIALDRIINACTRKGLAESAIYQYSRGGTDISGASIRLAEAIAQNWGNVQYGVREIEQRDGESTVQAYAWDMETNVRAECTFQVPHVRYTKKTGAVKLTDPRDIYELVANNGSRRLRRCILEIIPSDVVDTALQQCELTLKANADCSPEAIKKMLKAFGDFGVTKAQIEKRIQRRADTMQPAQMVQLKKIYLSLRDGISTPSDWFEESNLTSVDSVLAENVETSIDTNTGEILEPVTLQYTTPKELKGMIEAAESNNQLVALWETVPDDVKPKFQEQFNIKQDLLRFG